MLRSMFKTLVDRKPLRSPLLSRQTRAHDSQLFGVLAGEWRNGSWHITFTTWVGILNPKPEVVTKGHTATRDEAAAIINREKEARLSFGWREHGHAPLLPVMGSPWRLLRRAGPA